MEKKLESYINEQEGKLAKMRADTDPSNTLFHIGIIFQLQKTIEDLKSLNEAIVRKPLTKAEKYGNTKEDYDGY